MFFLPNYISPNKISILFDHFALHNNANVIPFCTGQVMFGHIFIHFDSDTEYILQR